MELPENAPARVGRYEVVSHLATGGMAEIYLARMAGMGAFERHVVLKTILPERASDQRFITMFLDEAKVAATLNHQNIAQVYEVDQADGAYFMAMEYVHGENVRVILETAIRKRQTISYELATYIISNAAAGLNHAHERKARNGQPLNIVHRDVSPANVMVGYDGCVKVLDFGIAKAEERSTKTVGNTIKGKYGYMSPEQCKGAPLDRRSDIFALGIVLYELTVLRRAFRGNDDFETMKKIVSGELVRPTKAISGYPVELEAIIMTALATKPEARFQTAQELIDALDEFGQRSKLIGSASGMARFMVALFGEKQEPWHEISTSRSNQLANKTGQQPAVVDERTHIMEQLPEMDTGSGNWSPKQRAQQDDDAMSAAQWAEHDSTTAQRHDARARPSERGTPGRPGSERSSGKLPMHLATSASGVRAATAGGLRPADRLEAKPDRVDSGKFDRMDGAKPDRVDSGKFDAAAAEGGLADVRPRHGQTVPPPLPNKLNDNGRSPSAPLARPSTPKLADATGQTAVSNVPSRPIILPPTLETAPAKSGNATLIVVLVVAAAAALALLAALLLL